MMQSKVVLHIRNSFLLDTSTYVSTAVMALLGISGLHTWTLQVVALALCLTFALLYRFLFRTGAYERTPVIYFGLQAGALTFLLLLQSDAGDAFNFLFYILTVHAAVVLTVRAAAAWVTFYFAIASMVVLLNRGADGLYAVFFYLAAFVICAILGYTVQQTELTSNRNQQLLDELKEAQERLKDLVVVEERNRFARDLHDSVKQQVFAISMQLSAARTSLLETDKAYQSVTEAERLAQQAGAELISLINALRPPSLESKSLTEAVKDYVSEWSQRTNIEVRLSIDDDLPLSTNDEQVYYRVIQEALSNVARHSQAAHVSVELLYKDPHILFCIVDDGKGINLENMQKGVGLNSMQERLTQIGGTFNIISEKGHGMQITSTLERS